MSATLPSFTNVCATIQREKTRQRVMNTKPKLRGKLVESSTNVANIGNQTSSGTRLLAAKGKDTIVVVITSFIVTIAAKMGIHRIVVGICTLICNPVKTRLHIRLRIPKSRAEDFKILAI